MNPPPPLLAEWEITRRCNTSCLHCCSESGPDVCREGELSTLEAMGFLAQLSAERVPMLTLTGGEPLMREDWAELARRACALGIGVNLTTNGALVTDEVADELAALPLASVTVSLDSHLPEVHDRLRQWPGLFELAVGAIRRLAARGARVVIGFAPSRLSRDSAGPLLELAENLGAAAVSVTELVASGRAPGWLTLSAPELRATLEEWSRLRDSWKGRTRVVLQDFRAAVPAPAPRICDREGCGAGRLFFRVRPDGSITPCSFLASPSFSIRREPLPGILTRLAAQPPGPPSGLCVNCEQRAAAAEPRA